MICIYYVFMKSSGDICAMIGFSNSGKCLCCLLFKFSNTYKLYWHGSGYIIAKAKLHIIKYNHSLENT